MPAALLAAGKSGRQQHCARTGGARTGRAPARVRLHACIKHKSTLLLHVGARVAITQCKTLNDDVPPVLPSLKEPEMFASLHGQAGTYSASWLEVACCHVTAGLSALTVQKVSGTRTLT